MNTTSNAGGANEKTLNEHPTSSNHLPTIKELGPYQSGLPSWLDRLWHYCTRAVKYSLLQIPVPNGEVLYLVETLNHIDHRLADSDPSSHDVYLVSKPTQSYSLQMFASFEHWSVYSQGHFYHLSAPQKPRQLHKASRQLIAGVHKKPCLKHEDFSSSEAADYIKFKTSERKARPLIAYKVGQTDQLPDQLQTLAQSLIDGMPAYDLWSANCQHFSVGMLDRILVRLGDRSAFLGTAIQIVEWDLLVDKTKPGAYKNVDLGYWLHAPRPARPTWVQSVKWSLRTVFIESESFSIVKIPFRSSEEGPRKPIATQRYAGPPEGFRKPTRGDLREIGSAVKELKDDIKRKNWRDAWRGRPATWVYTMEKRKKEHRRPHRRTKRVQADLVWDVEEERWKWKSELSWKTLAIGIL
ncbi:MAG: hypothetical protein M1836_004712 [Candelina mexicana]|nr:MAG: hypothetical protein M1836_004712 [Candelina mexicana]